MIIYNREYYIAFRIEAINIRRIRYRNNINNVFLLDVGDLEGRVGGRLHPDHLGVGPHGLADLLGVSGVHERRLDPQAGGDLRQKKEMN